MPRGLAALNQTVCNYPPGLLPALPSLSLVPFRVALGIQECFRSGEAATIVYPIYENLIRPL